MFGDDQDPLVMTALVRSGRSFWTRLRRWSVAEQRNKAIACEWVVGLRTVNEDKRFDNRSTKIKREAVTTNGYEFCEKHADAMRMMR